jgi:ABC-type antimicrobial peptide transport system permease subunit
LADSDWLAIGIVIGVLVGIPLGWIIAQAISKPTPSSLIFDRDERGRITAIHYVLTEVK